MKNLLIAIAIIVFASSVIYGIRKKKNEIPTPTAAQLAEEQRKSVERQQKAFDERQAAVAGQFEAQRKGEVERNAPERERLSRDYPETYRALAMKVGGSLEDCVVTSQRNPMTDPKPMSGGKPGVFLSADCGKPGMPEMAGGNN